MIPTHLRVLLATAAVDMRRSFDGLARLVVETLDEDPRSAHSLLVFVNHKRDRLKVLWRDTRSWCLLDKCFDENIVEARNLALSVVDSAPPTPAPCASTSWTSTKG